jgi:drug/metabolite transporter (DMT)-like permease
MIKIMDLSLIGQTAALLTAGLWSINSILFASAGKKIGSISVNAYRIILALLFLSISHLILFGSIYPIASYDQWFWIGLSGIIGLGIGDFALFEAFVIIGPRRSVLIMALSPVFGAILAYGFLNETISMYALLGIIITLIGIVIVILEKEEKSFEEKLSQELKFKGVSLAFIGALGQGIGVVVAKKGMLFESNNIINPLSATLIRMTLASIFIWLTVLLAGKLPELKKALKNSQGIKNTTAGAFIGPFLGVTFSMVAVTYTKIGIAQTLMSLMPVMIIPILWFGYKQKTNLRGITGAFIAIVGVAILFLI